MNGYSLLKPFLFLFSALAILSGCSQKKVSLPDFSEDIQVASVEQRSLEEWVPAYGLVLKGGVLELSIEAHDSGRVKAGQQGLAHTQSQAGLVPYRVQRVLPNASAETGQALVWMQPQQASPLKENDFAFAQIKTGLRRHALAVPNQALLVKDGKSIVIAQQESEGKKTWAAVEVQTGLESNGWQEIKSGLKQGDQILVQGTLGYLYPDFKSSSSGD